MATWKEAVAAVHGAVHGLEERFDALRYRLSDRLGQRDPVLILPYRGFGTEERFVLRGRVLEDKGLHPASDRDSVWDNILAMYRRLESDEVPGARLRARFGEVVCEVVTDDEGYFVVELEPPAERMDDRVWYEVELELLDAVAEGQGPVRATGHVLVPPLESTFGVISDVDDTVLRTDATSLVRMAQVTFLNNARTRLPFEGVAAFYRALQRGPGGTGHNPLFYVSSSPWNLYDLLAEFCDVHAVPIGPFLLRDLGIDRNKFIKAGHLEHKGAQVERILRTYPRLPFLLIGDSGQQDPEIYRRVVEAFPGRIRAIYIRDVSGEPRDAEVRAIADEVRGQGVPMLFVENTEAAAVHAAAEGYIHPSELPNVRAEKAKDEAPPGPV